MACLRKCDCWGKGLVKQKRRGMMQRMGKGNAKLEGKGTYKGGIESKDDVQR